jgi:hypothetical protein
MATRKCEGNPCGNAGIRHGFMLSPPKIANGLAAAYLICTPATRPVREAH